VKKREIHIPIEIHQQAMDLGEEMTGVAAPKLGGVLKPLAFGQYGELGPGFEQLLDQLAEEGADEAAKLYLIPNRVVTKGVMHSTINTGPRQKEITCSWSCCLGAVRNHR
jgi:hypothetical protein